MRWPSELLEGIDPDDREPLEQAYQRRLYHAILLGFVLGIVWSVKEQWRLDLPIGYRVLLAIPPVVFAVLCTVPFLFMIPMEERSAMPAWKPGFFSHVYLALFCGFFSWWLSAWADAAAWAQMDLNSAASLGGDAQSARELLVESLRRDLLDWRGMLFASAIFGIPALAMVILYRHPTARIVVLTITLALLIWDLAVALAPHGGDRKGCTNCEAPAIAHLLAGVFILTGSLVTAAAGWVRRLFPPDEKSRRAG